MKLRQTLLLTLLGALPAAGMAQRHVPVTAPGRLFEEGRQLSIQKDYAAALRALKDFVKTDGQPFLQRSEADYMIACTAYELKQKDCIRTLETYLATHPDSPYKHRVNALIANALIYEKDYEHAIHRFEGCELDRLGDEERDEMTLHLAIAHIETGDLDEAYALLSVVQACTPKYQSDVDFYRAYIDYVNGRYADALPVFQRLEDDRKYAGEAPYYVADIYLRQGQYTQAEQVAGRYVSVRPDGNHGNEMQRILGGAYYGQGRYDDALRALETYVRNTDNPERNALYQLGLCHYRNGAWQRACDNLGRATVIKDALAQNAYLHMGLAFLQLQDKRQAQLAFEQASLMNYDP